MSTGIENLKIYQMAESLELEVHEFTKIFPSDERFRSVDQLLRSSAAVANNIAEAYRKITLREQVHILRSIVLGEAEETRTNLVRCGKKCLCDQQHADDLAEKYVSLIKATQGYVRFLQQSDTRKTHKLTNS